MILKLAHETHAENEEEVTEQDSAQIFSLDPQFEPPYSPSLRRLDSITYGLPVPAPPILSGSPSASLSGKKDQKVYRVSRVPAEDTLGLGAQV